MAATTALIPSAAKAKDSEPPPRVAEDEERDVDPELLVGLPERGRVAPGQEFQGLTTRGAAGEQADQDRHDDHDPGKAGLEKLPIALQQRAGRGLGAHPRPQPIGDRCVRGDHRGHDQPEGHEQADPGHQHLAEHRAEAERLIPQTVGPHAGEDRKRHHQHSDDHQRRQDCTPASTDSQATQPTSPQAQIVCLTNEPPRPHGSARGTMFPRFAN